MGGVNVERLLDLSQNDKKRGKQKLTKRKGSKIIHIYIYIYIYIYILLCSLFFIYIYICVCVCVCVCVRKFQQRIVCHYFLFTFLRFYNPFVMSFTDVTMQLDTPHQVPTWVSWIVPLLPPFSFFSLSFFFFLIANTKACLNQITTAKHNHISTCVNICLQCFRMVGEFLGMWQVQ